MNLFRKQLLLGIFSVLVLTIIILGATFTAFPVNHWRDLFTVEIYYEIPYFLFIIIFVLIAGLIVGISYSMYMKSKIKLIRARLEELKKDQPIAIDELNNFQELKEIKEAIVQLEHKFLEQASLSQRLATERAEEREKSLQEVVVQERNRLARELHDSVSQQLFAASMMMSAINENTSIQDTNLQKQLKMVEKMIDQSQLEMRALLLHLRPVALKEKTLEEGMEKLLFELQQKVPMEVSWKIEKIQLEKGVEDHLFRILQEAVSNALRHSKANHLNVLLIKRDDNVIMRVVDDGIGFDVDKEKSSSSYGLKNMHERALEIGGTLKVVSIKNEGTRLEVKIPLRKEN